jgi:hypothetical protein
VIERLAIVVALVVGVACGQSDRAGRTIRLVQLDTLPNGVVRTISSAPIEPGQWQLALLHTVQPAEGQRGELLQPQELALRDDGTLLVSESGDAQVKVSDGCDSR